MVVGFPEVVDRCGKENNAAETIAPLYQL